MFLESSSRLNVFVKRSKVNSLKTLHNYQFYWVILLVGNLVLYTYLYNVLFPHKRNNLSVV